MKSSGGADITVIDGMQSGSVAAFKNYEGKGSVLEGFTLTNGYGLWYNSAAYLGGGICCIKSSPSIIKGD